MSLVWFSHAWLRKIIHALVAAISLLVWPNFPLHLPTPFKIKQLIMKESDFNLWYASIQMKIFTEACSILAPTREKVY